MAWTGLTLTVEGRNALNRAQADGRLCFKSLVVGDGNPPANFGTQKELVHGLYELTDIKIDITEDGCALTADFPAVDYDYYFREIGVIVDTEDGEKLYAYDNCGDDAQYIVTTTGAERTQKRIRIYLTISDVEEVTVSTPSILYVDYDDYEREIVRLEDNIAAAKREAAEALADHIGNQLNPHAVTKVQVGLGNVNNTSDENKPVSTAQQAALDGKLDKTGDAKDNTVTYTSADVADGGAAAWTSVAKLTTGEKLSSVLSKVSTMFKNIRYLYKMLGTTDISAIGGGTVTGAISKLNTDLGKKQNAATAINTSNIGSQSVNYATSAGTAANADAVDGFHASQNSTQANTCIVRDRNGYTNVGYISSSTSRNENPIISQIIVTNGSDDYYRKASIAHLKNSLNFPLRNRLNVELVPTGISVERSYQNNVLKGKDFIVAIFYSSVGNVFVTKFSGSCGQVNTKNDNQYWGGEVHVNFNEPEGKVNFTVAWMGTSQNLNNFRLSDILY